MRTTVIAMLAGLTFACGGNVDGSSNGAGSPAPSPAGSSTANGNPSSGTSGTNTSEAADSSGDRCFGRPRCGTRDVEYATEAEACVPTKGTSCHEATCDFTMWCRRYDEQLCKGVFDCDHAQAEVKTCPPGAECVVKTTCGRSIVCQKLDPDCEAPAPRCLAGETQRMRSSECPFDKDCFTRANECGFTVWCSPF